MPKTMPTADRERDLYLDLVREFPLRPIRSDEGHDRAIAMIDDLSDRASLAAEERDYLLVLADLIAAYESGREPAPEATPGEILRELIESNGLSQSGLAAETGIAESTISEVLAGRRPISRKAMYAFAERFRVDPGLFV